jgi:hypothetical protein
VKDADQDIVIKVKEEEITVPADVAKKVSVEKRTR